MTEFKSFSRWSALLFSLAGQREKERMGVGGGPSTLSDGCGRTNRCSCRCERVYSAYVPELNLCLSVPTARSSFGAEDDVSVGEEAATIE